MLCDLGDFGMQVNLCSLHCVHLRLKIMKFSVMMLYIQMLSVVFLFEANQGVGKTWLSTTC